MKFIILFLMCITFALGEYVEPSGLKKKALQARPMPSVSPVRPNADSALNYKVRESVPDRAFASDEELDNASGLIGPKGTSPSSSAKEYQELPDGEGMPGVKKWKYSTP